MHYTFNPPQSYYDPPDPPDEYPPEFYKHRVIKSTRKPHVCIMCGDTIPTGSRTSYYVTVDGEEGFNHGWYHMQYNGECIK